MMVMNNGQGPQNENRSTKDTNKAILDLLMKSNRIKISGLNGQNNIAVGLKGQYEIDIHGNAGNFLAAFNNGPVIILHGNCGKFAGDNIISGGLIIIGDCDDLSGISMSGGILVVKGNVGNECGKANYNGTILVDGNASGNIGTDMKGGTLIITGRIDGMIGDGATGGEFYHCGEVKIENEMMRNVNLSEKDLSKLRKYFDHYGIKAYPKTFTKLVPIKGRKIE